MDRWLRIESAGGVTVWMLLSGKITPVDRDQCPQCGGELDTGWECNACGFDAMPEAHQGPAKLGGAE